MATKSKSEPNKFLGLKKAIAGLHKDIAFLKQCLTHKLTPTSHKIVVKTAVDSKIVKKLEMNILRSSIKKLYSILNMKTLECYSLHLKLAKENQFSFSEFLTKVNVAEFCESERKRKLLNKKFKKLKSNSPKFSSSTHTHTNNTSQATQNLVGLVVNRSSEQFSEEQLTLLNKGLNYAIHTQPDTTQTIIDIETAINTNNLNTSQIQEARSETAKVLKNTTQSPPTQNKQHTTEHHILKQLKDKPVFYLKADKGNSTVIMDKVEYDQIMSDKIVNGPYRKQRVDPLPGMIRRVDKVLKECKPVFGNEISGLKESNPSLPRIKGLPKVHKPGNEMREIISAIGSPTHKIGKWLVNEFQNMPNQFQSKSVKNAHQFTQFIQDTEIAEDEVLVSFDVKALFPSIPVKEAIELLENWLLSQNDDADWKKKVKSYVKLTQLCMEENYFTFRNESYKQLKGAPMGNPLSPFLSEIFMANFEKRLTDNDQLPRVWWRYVDDVFSIVKKSLLPLVLDTINNTHKNIEFTCEIEKDSKLPFLDILIVKEQSKLTFEIYRKPTHTQRTIPNTSNHSHQHKMASFNHMIHRLQTLPLSTTGKNKELDYIFDTARLNGYSQQTIQNIIDKKTKQQYKRTLTTLTQTQPSLKRIAVNYNNDTKKLRPVLRKFGFELVFTSRNNQLQTLLGSTKDPIDNLGKSGVYKITCDSCDKIYIGQTKRTLNTRFKEHISEVTKANKDTDKGLTHHFKSKVAEHIFNEKHFLNTDNAKIIKHITNPWKLNVAESIEIFKQNSTQLLNKDQGNGYSWLFKFIPNTHSHHTQHSSNRRLPADQAGICRS